MPGHRESKLELHDRKVQFGIWLGIPPECRKPKSQVEYAAQIDVTPVTLSRWVADPTVQEAKRNALALFYNQKDVFKVTEVVTNKALGGSISAARLLYELTGNIKQVKAKDVAERQEISIKIVAPKAENGTQN